MNSSTENLEMSAYPWRFRVATLIVMVGFLLLAARVVELQIFEHEFLNGEGDARVLRVEKLEAHRGMIFDRNQQPLAVSTPVVSVWVNPLEIEDADYAGQQLARLLKMDADLVRSKMSRQGSKAFVYVRRQLPPATGEAVKELKLGGVYTQREYQRFYPAGEVAAHLIGFTNIDDRGQEGIELAYNDWLEGVAGRKQVVKNRVGQIIEDVQLLESDKPGKAIELSIDLRLQYLAYRELKAAVHSHKAKSGSLVLLDVKSGEVLALVNQPSYNPNNKSTLNHTNLRNRALTDVFEPGSTVKPLTIAAALESGKFKPSSVVNTAPGYLRFGRDTIRDTHNYGKIDLVTLIAKSSNVGATKVALALNEDAVWNVYSRAGFGKDTGSGFPGERIGLLPYHESMREVERATFSYGYGLSVTALQLAQAYTVFANHGKLMPISLLKVDDATASEAVLSAKTADQVLAMLEKVVAGGGTGSRASIPAFRVAGKTGTVHKLGEGGYQDDKYLAVFAGIAPVSDPRFVAVVVVDEPSGGDYYGGEVAAPVFSRVVAGALRLLNVTPDNIDSESTKVVRLPAKGLDGPA